MAACELATEMTEEIGVEAEFVLQEPCLKYHRLENDFPAMCRVTEVTTMAAHFKFIAFGCKNGAVNILDHMGHLIKDGYYKKHFSPVNVLQISEDGEYAISCGDDGFVIIYTLMQPHKTECVNLRRPVKCVTFSPEFGLNRQFVAGGNKLVLSSKGKISRYTNDELYSPPGLIRSIKWRRNLLIWVDDQAVRVYNLWRRAMVNVLPLLNDSKELVYGRLPCHLAWHSDDCFLIGRGGLCQICKIKENTPAEFEGRWSSVMSVDQCSNSSVGSTINIPRGMAQYVQVINQVCLPDGLICGLTTHQTYVLLLLQPTTADDGLLSENTALRKPQVIIADVGNMLCSGCMPSANDSCLSLSFDSYDEVNREEVTLNQSGAQRFQDIGLASIPGEGTHFIFSSVDAIYAQVLSADDRIDWYLDQNLPQQALTIAKEHSNDLVRHSPKALGIRYLDYLIEESKFSEAAALCRDILTSRQDWEDQVFRFLEFDQLQALAPYLPTSSYKLRPTVYETVLLNLMSKEPEVFFYILNKWQPSSGLFALDPLISNLTEKTSSICPRSDMATVAKQNKDMSTLWRALILLYEHSDSPERGLELSIQLEDIAVFDLLRRQLPTSRCSRLVNLVRQHLVTLFNMNAQSTVHLLIDCMREIPVDFVVRELDAHPLMLYQYLDAVHSRYPQSSLPHIPRMVHLYAKYAREKLLHFLRSTDHYQLKEALELCRSLNYIPETVYLLTRVGCRRDALQLLMEKGAYDEFLVGDKSFTPEQRQAEVAAQAIAYCLAEDSCGDPYYEYGTPKRAPILWTNPQYSNCSVDNEATDEDDDDGAGYDDYLDSNARGDVEADNLGPADHFLAATTPGEAGELWKQVVLFAVDKPSFICALLKHASTERIDPRLLLQKIAPNTEIPHLKQSLVTLLHNTQMQLELRRNCRRILAKDSHDLFTHLAFAQRRGLFVNLMDYNTCKICRQPLLRISGSAMTPTATSVNGGDQSPGFHQPTLTVFHCSHSYHKDCLSHFHAAMVCPVCVQGGLV